MVAILGVTATASAVPTAVTNSSRHGPPMPPMHSDFMLVDAAKHVGVHVEHALTQMSIDEGLHGFVSLCHFCLSIL